MGMCLPMSISITYSGAPKIFGVDGVRGIAMLMVFAFHTWEFSGHPPWSLGTVSLGDIVGRFHLGVDLFIVLSGFCLYWPVANTMTSPRKNVQPS